MGRLLGGLLLDLGHLLLGLDHHVGLGRQRLNGLAELLAGLFDLFAQLFGGGRGFIALRLIGQGVPST